MHNIEVKGEWFFEYEDGSIEGPFLNFITTAGLAKIAEGIEKMSSPYIVVGDDAAAGEAITEVFRKPVSTVNRTGNLVRFRTQLLPTECNGNHSKVSIFVEASDSPGTGVMLNILVQPWSKADNTALTVETRITVNAL